jgi:hypothetical protein
VKFCFTHASFDAVTSMTCSKLLSLDSSTVACPVALLILDICLVGSLNRPLERGFLLCLHAFICAARCRQGSAFCNHRGTLQ